MKKLFLVLLCAVMFAGVSNAQKVQWGVKGGLNLSNMYSDGDSANNLAGIFIGGSMEYKVSKWAYGFDLIYSQKGAKSEEEMLGERPEIHLDYISFIPTAKYYVSNNFNFQGGLQFGINTNAELTYKGESKDLEDVNNFDLGLVLGGEYVFDMGLGLIGRYCFGLTAINDDDSEDVKNAALQLGVSYRF